MNTLKPVRLRHAWQGWPKGHVFTAMPAAQAEHMVAAGQAEYGTAAVASPANRMMTAPEQKARAVGRRARSAGRMED